VNSSTIWALVSLVISVMGAYFTARLSSRAQDKTASANADVSSGQLALSIAKEANTAATTASRKIELWERWARRVSNWSTVHEAWDLSVEKELHNLDPTWTHRVPARQEFPPPPEEI
jgi:HAMP domain-containing protein